MSEEDRNELKQIIILSRHIQAYHMPLREAASQAYQQATALKNDACAGPDTTNAGLNPKD